MPRMDDALERARQLEQEEKCLICETTRKPQTRGLCVKHYNRFLTAKDSLDEDRQEEYEQTLIGRGLLLPNKQGSKIKPADNIFAVIRDEVASGSIVARDVAEG